MAAKLSDTEFVERTRANNRRRAERQRQRLSRSGRSALTVWIPDAVRAALTAKAANDGATIAATAAELLSAALAQSAASPAPARTLSVDTLPLFDAAVALETPDDRLARILALKREQPELSNYAIADRVGCSEPTVRRALKRLKQETAE